MKNLRKYKVFYRYNLLHCHRQLNTTAERRQIYYDDMDPELKEYRVKIRRRRMNVPQAWDDLMVGEWNTWKSWKDHSKRRKQWLALNENNEKPDPLWVPTVKHAIEYHECDRPPPRFGSRKWHMLHNQVEGREPQE